MTKHLKSSALFIMSMMSVSSYAQDAAVAASSLTEKTSDSIGSNPLFISMAILTAVLLLVIVILSSVLKTSVKTKVREFVKAKPVQAIVTLLMLFASQSVFAQTAESATESIYVDTPIGGMHPMAFYSLFGVLLIELFVILWLCIMILRIIVKKEAVSAAAHNEAAPSAFSTFISRKIFGVKPVETDKDVLLDHDYDGIKELDNDLPPWWKYGFYFTIITGVIYMIGYHVTGSFKLSHEEYDTEMAEAEVRVAAYRTKMAMNVDETNAVFVTEADKIAKGGEIFKKNCVACHGEQGQGTIGPNFTDNHWLYGNKPGDMFKIVKNGTAKGMKAWKDELSPLDIQNVISYIHTLKGTNPPNPKAPEGELFEDSGVAPVANDSTSAPAAIDSSKNIEIK